ncbi:hypothetical protein PR202_gb22758 [Eleusine coracana subsp. coracana]|uniref:Strictosidine synthase conserved region domain-containing protein n=1 Tax=Eleusine coracana subsp. coracana TaxID=191504 RepID=A0AAV5FHE4_ELECO|nr:hypothetical protein PR202_gb22758 [Eleusine coracana subsp. coracana]
MAAGRSLKLALFAISFLILLLAPSTTAARITRQGPLRQRLGRARPPWDEDGGGWKTFAYGPGYFANNCGAPSTDLPSVAKERLCGRPLGLRFHRASGDLYIADAYAGLMRAGKNGGEATVLASGVNGVPFKLTNGLDVDQVTGDVYFTDSSSRYSRAQNQLVTRTGDATGRVLKYDARTKQVSVLMSGLAYPNDVAVSADRTHLVVALTGPCKLLRYWLGGPEAGKYEVFADLPGYPDNVKPDGKGGYLVGLNMEKLELPFPFGPNKHIVGVRIGAQGEKMQEITGPKAMRLSEVVEKEDGRIYLGSVESSYVGVVSTAT